MRTTTIGVLAACAAVLSACGSTKTFANKPRPATPVNVTVYLNDSRVSLSPTTVGAGPIVFIVTNQASKSISLNVLPPGGSGSQPLADTGPISPQATAQVTVDLSSGDYTISAGQRANTDAALASASPIQSAKLHIGPPRPSGSNALLQP
jgi:hypothetical protein